MKWIQLLLILCSIALFVFDMVDKAIYELLLVIYLKLIDDE